MPVNMYILVIIYNIISYVICVFIVTKICSCSEKCIKVKPAETDFRWIALRKERNVWRFTKARICLLEERCFINVYYITKTYLYSFDPLKPHFYIVKLGFTGVYIIFLISAQKHRLWVLVRTASNEYPQSMFWAEIWNISEIFIWKISVFGGEIFYIFE